jgi:hypothetical protein
MDKVSSEVAQTLLSAPLYIVDSTAQTKVSVLPMKEQFRHLLFDYSYSLSGDKTVISVGRFLDRPAAVRLTTTRRTVKKPSDGIL